MKELLEDMETVYQGIGYNGVLGFLYCKGKTKDFTNKEKEEIHDKMLELAIRSIDPNFLKAKKLIKKHLQHANLCDYLKAVEVAINEY